jgi:hypothetical protein
MAGGDLRETNVPRDYRQTFFMIRIFPGMNQGNGACLQPVCARLLQGCTRRGFIQRLDLAAVDRNPPRNFHHTLIEQGGQRDLKIE